jgi:hypothetical protein
VAELRRGIGAGKIVLKEGLMSTPAAGPALHARVRTGHKKRAAEGGSREFNREASNRVTSSQSENPEHLDRFIKADQP